MTRIIFMGTPDFAVPVLQTLIATQTVVGVVTQPDKPAGRGQQLHPSPVKQAAQAAGIPVYQPKSLRKEETAVPLRDWSPDLIVVAAFGQILRPHVLNLPPLGCLNVHASLLPRWRGASPIHHAILAGDATSGISLMRMDEGLDTGPVYIQEAIPLASDETAQTLHDKLAQLGAVMVQKYLADIVAGRLPAIPQPEEPPSTYAPMIQKEQGLIDWQKTAVAIERHIRAMTPWPGAFTTWQGQPLKILAAHLAEGHLPAGQPGTVKPWRETAVILTREGGLIPHTIQAAGKRAMSFGDFLRGHNHFIDTLLGESV